MIISQGKIPCHVHTNIMEEHILIFLQLGKHGDTGRKREIIGLSRDLRIKKGADNKQTHTRNVSRLLK